MPTVEQQMEEFRRRIDTLEKQAKKSEGALLLAPHQTGPRPGWFRAARIEGTQMILDFSASQVGVSPRISVTDTTGIVRAEMGNLAAVGNSPAQYGFRAMGSTGVPLFDSLGLIAVLDLAAQIGGLSGATIGGSTTFATIGSTANFTVSTRPQNFFCIASLECSASNDANNVGYFRVNINGQLSQTALVETYSTVGDAHDMVTLFVSALNLAVGTYTVKVEGKTGGGVTVAAIVDGSVQVYSFGF